MSSKTYTVKLTKAGQVREFEIISRRETLHANIGVVVNRDFHGYSVTSIRITK